ncbi:MAG: hypothetical protein OEX80_01755 [Candidatus Aminicenantes bacterium]|nr:hypothetical protein [Candidatus Aminicenantes bacterium]
MEEKSSANEIYDAMVIPRGAKIRVPEGVPLVLDVKGDLIFQESQSDFGEINTHFGSILIDRDVSIYSRSFSTKKMLIVQGTLTGDKVIARNLTGDEGHIRAREIRSRSIEMRHSRLESHLVEANELKIIGGKVEVGSVNAERIVLKEGVQGTIIISSVKEWQVDPTCRIKGCFESDIELLGYLAKYWRRILNQKALYQIEKMRKPESLPFVTPTLPEKEPLLPTEKEERELTARDEEPAVEPEELPSLKAALSILESEYPEVRSAPPIVRFVLQSLQNGDLSQLKQIYSKWGEIIDKGERDFSPRTRKAFFIIKSIIARNSEE